MSEEILEQTQRLELPLAETFELFADARNLEAITPPWLGFRVVGPAPIEMRPGALIDYRLRLRGIPIRWRTRIESWEPPHRFVDAQLSGPYALWHHTHTFDADGEATVIGDRVRYRIGYGPLGALALRLFVRGDLERIFEYRRDAILRLVAERGSARRDPVR